MTGTDGVAVSSYAFDDFGRNIDPRTGKQRKHEYTTNGNIIQPFAFTGYQEDEVSDLKYAQARFYDASTGRFQSEDNVKGFMDSPFTLNHYGYCFNNPKKYIDKDGNIPTVIAGAVIGGLIGGATVVSSLVKGEDINWGKVGANTFKGAAAGAGVISTAANYVNNPLEDIEYTSKVQQQMQLGDYHAFPEAVDAFGNIAKAEEIIGGDLVARMQYEIEGGYMGKEGVFQYIVELDNTCNHRDFIPCGY